MTTRRNFFASLVSTSFGASLAFRSAAADASPSASNTGPGGVRYLTPSENFESSLRSTLEDLDDTGGDILLAPGSYRLARPLTLARFKTDKHKGERLPIIRISGYGATFNQTLEIDGRAFNLAGLRVVNAEGPGFKFSRSQQSHFTDLQAIDCGHSGFLLGGSAGAQVAFGVWVNCLALGCARNGWELVADDQNSWVNANTFMNCISRSNGGTGLVATSTVSRVNYNHFFAMQIEGNGGISVDFKHGARANDLHGGHFVDKNAAGVAIELGDGHNQMFGGRSVGLVTGGSAVITQSPAYRGKGMLVRVPDSEHMK